MLASLLLAAALTTTPVDSVIRRGTALGDKPGVALEQVLAAPERYAQSSTPILIEGVVIRNCTSQGCWMQVAPTGEQAGIRVTMKDHSFLIPLNSKGMKARALGVLKVKQHAKEHADHLEGEGAYLVRNADGTATEVTFVAEGVELRS